MSVPPVNCSQHSGQGIACISGVRHSSATYTAEALLLAKRRLDQNGALRPLGWAETQRCNYKDAVQFNLTQCCFICETAVSNFPILHSAFENQTDRSTTHPTTAPTPNPREKRRAKKQSGCFCSKSANLVSPFFTMFFSTCHCSWDKKKTFNNVCEVQNSTASANLTFSTTPDASSPLLPNFSPIRLLSCLSWSS